MKSKFNSFKGIPQLLKQKLILLVLLSLISSFFCGCSKFSPGEGEDAEKPEYITRTELLLSTVVTINLYDKQDQDILDGCFDLIAKYEEVFSRTSETSELYALNHRLLPQVDGAYQISEDLADIINKAIYYGDLSKGGFDISIEPVSSIWDFLSDPPVIPTEQQLEKALPLVNYKYIHLKDQTVSFENDEVRLDLGGIAKGYIADHVKEYLKSQGVESAIINLGGNVLCVGT
ncbi:MAG: FAD:protein FMN transferase, partial [Mobilitalea sp.]